MATSPTVAGSLSDALDALDELDTVIAFDQVAVRQDIDSSLKEAENRDPANPGVAGELIRGVVGVSDLDRLIVAGSPEPKCGLAFYVSDNEGHRSTFLNLGSYTKWSLGAKAG